MLSKSKLVITLLYYYAYTDLLVQSLMNLLTIWSNLKSLYKQKLEYIICSDFNVNFLVDSGSAQQLTLLLQSYNLFHITVFPTRLTKNSFSAMDNILIDYTRINSFQVFLITGVSDHEAQYLCVNTILDWPRGNFRLVKKRPITKSVVSNCIAKLKNESCNNIIKHTDVNTSFHLFLNIFLIVFLGNR